jgi:hypothetical protein
MVRTYDKIQMKRAALLVICLHFLLLSGILKAQFSAYWHFSNPEGYQFNSFRQVALTNEARNAIEGCPVPYTVSVTVPFYPTGIDKRNNNPLIAGKVSAIIATGAIFGNRDNPLLCRTVKCQVSGRSPSDKFPSYWGLVVLGSVLLCVGAIYINIRMS